MKSYKLLKADGSESIQPWTGLIVTNVVCQHLVSLSAEAIEHLFDLCATFD